MRHAAPTYRHPVRAGMVALFLLVGLLGPPPSRAQSGSDSLRAAPSHMYAPDAGRIPQRYVAPDAYDASKQNWDATQDTSGTFYVGNTEGVLVYDGHAWRTLQTANQSIVRSVAADGHGRVFVGAEREFGVVRRDSTGRPRYTSLLDHVPEKHRSFTDVWKTETSNGQVYFYTRRRLFRWTPAADSMASWAPPQGTEFGQGGAARGTFFVKVPNRGLMAARGDSLRMVKGGEVLSGRSVVFVRAHAQHGLVVGTYDGLFVREGDSFRRLQTDAPDLIRSAWIQRGRVLSDGTIAIATIDQGLLLIAPDGTLRRRLTPRDAPVLGVYEDDEGGVWALMDGGMMRYDLAAPFTEYGSETGLEGSVQDVARHRGRLYVATLRNLYRRRVLGDSVAMVREPEINTQSWALLSVGKDLLVGTVRGLNRVGPDGAVRRLFDTNHVYALHQSRQDSTRVYAGTGRGVRLVRRTDTGWAVGPKIPGLNTKAETLAETDDGTLWVGTSFEGGYRVRLDDPIDSTTVEHFDTDHGLLSDNVVPHRWNGEVVFGTSAGLMRFVKAPSPHFKRVTSIEMPPFPRNEGDVRLQTLADGQAWGFSEWGPGRWRRRDSTWHWAPGVLHRLRGRSVNVLRAENDGRRLWMGTQEGLLRYTPAAPGPGSPPPVRIQEARVLGTDSLLAIRGTSSREPALPYAQNGVRVAYGTPSLAQPSAVEYQYRVSGRRGQWSDWTSRTVRELQNLSPGPVTFSVRARTAYGDTTTAAQYSFSVLPPWYRTWWAYGGYGLLALLLVGGAVQWRTRWLRRRQERLERTVAERTEEVRRQRNRLEEQAEKLRELDAAKSRFFANLSHEFRTPLTLIRGPIREVREHLDRGQLEPVDDAAEGDAEQLSLVERNVDRLQRLIDQILGLARLEAGTYEIDARPTDVAAAIERLVREFEPLAERAGLALRADGVDETGTAEPSPVYLDREALHRIVSNLVSNAIKYTPGGGRVEVTVCERPDAVEIAVRDTGPGIPEDEQDTLFERFARADAPPSNGGAIQEQEGIGIGLAFTKDLVELHGGTIALDSAEGEGTTVTVRFPRGTDALREDQLAAPQQSGEGTPAGPSEEEQPPSFDAASSSLDSQSASPSEHVPAHDSDSTSAEQSQKAPNDQSKIVLVVDDNADVREYVRSVLTPDFAVIEAADGKEGTAMAREHLPDVILADVMMPKTDGYEMTRRLKDDPETEAIPVIMVTARAETRDEVKGLQVGADDYVTKPFDTDVLRQRVGGVLTLQQRLRRRLEEQLEDEGIDESASEDGQRPEIERRARTAVRDHLTDPDFGVSDLADALAMSRSTLYRKLKAEADVTPSTLLRQVRVDEAAALLRGGEPATQVAYAVGYESLSSFSTAFQAEHGATPSTYAAEHAPDR